METFPPIDRSKFYSCENGYVYKPPSPVSIFPLPCSFAENNVFEKQRSHFHNESTLTSTGDTETSNFSIVQQSSGQELLCTGSNEEVIHFKTGADSKIQKSYTSQGMPNEKNQAPQQKEMGDRDAKHQQSIQNRSGLIIANTNQSIFCENVEEDKRNLDIATLKHILADFFYALLDKVGASTEEDFKKDLHAFVSSFDSTSTRRLYDSCLQEFGGGNKTDYIERKDKSSEFLVQFASISPTLCTFCSAVDTLNKCNEEFSKALERLKRENITQNCLMSFFIRHVFFKLELSRGVLSKILEKTEEFTADFEKMVREKKMELNNSSSTLRNEKFQIGNEYHGNGLCNSAPSKGLYVSRPARSDLDETSYNGSKKLDLPEFGGSKTEEERKLIEDSVHSIKVQRKISPAAISSVTDTLTALPAFSLPPNAVNTQLKASCDTPKESSKLDNDRNLKDREHNISKKTFSRAVTESTHRNGSDDTPRSNKLILPIADTVRGTPGNSSTIVVSKPLQTLGRLSVPNHLLLEDCSRYFLQHESVPRMGYEQSSATALPLGTEYRASADDGCNYKNNKESEVPDPYSSTRIPFATTGTVPPNLHYKIVGDNYCLLSNSSSLASGNLSEVYQDQNAYNEMGNRNSEANNFRQNSNKISFQDSLTTAGQFFHNGQSSNNSGPHSIVMNQVASNNSNIKELNNLVRDTNINLNGVAAQRSSNEGEASGITRIKVKQINDIPSPLAIGPPSVKGIRVLQQIQHLEPNTANTTISAPIAPFTSDNAQFLLSEASTDANYSQIICPDAEFQLYKSYFDQHINQSVDSQRFLPFYFQGQEKCKSANISNFTTVPQPEIAGNINWLQKAALQTPRNFSGKLKISQCCGDNYSEGSQYCEAQQSQRHQRESHSVFHAAPLRQLNIPMGQIVQQPRLSKPPPDCWVPRYKVKSGKLFGNNGTFKPESTNVEIAPERRTKAPSPSMCGLGAFDFWSGTGT